MEEVPTVSFNEISSFPLIFEELVDMRALTYLFENYDEEMFKTLGGLHNFTKGYNTQDFNTSKTILTNYYSMKKQTNAVVYHHTGFMRGRLFSKTSSLQNLNKKIRHTLSRDIYYDIDMVNAHPKLLEFYCKIHSISCPNLSQYISTREPILQGLMSSYKLTRDEAKQLVLTILNGGHKGKMCRNSFEGDFTEEMKLVRATICTLEPECNEKSLKKEYNQDGTCINYLMCQMENCILQLIVDYCLKKMLKLEPLCLMDLWLSKSPCLTSTLS
jgi:hypothetical protein